MSTSDPKLTGYYYSAAGGYVPKRARNGEWRCPSCRQMRTGRICKPCRTPRPK